MWEVGGRGGEWERGGGVWEVSGRGGEWERGGGVWEVSSHEEKGSAVADLEI